MSKKNKQPLVPRLRFPEFRESGVWEIKILNTLAERKTERNKKDNLSRVLTNSAVYGVVDQRDYFKKDIANQRNLDNYFIIDMGEYVYNPRISATAPVGPISKNKVGKGVMSPIYTVFKFDNQNNDFYEHYFKTTFWYKYLRNISNMGARYDRITISNHDFMNMPLLYPSEPERQRITDCLSSLDDLITTENEKLEVLKVHKKGLMQKLFTQKFRFKNKSGNNFPNWDKKRLGDLGDFFGGLTGKTKEDFGIGKSEYITYMNVFKNILSNDKILEKVNIKEMEKQNKVIYGDLLFTQSSETCEEVGMSSVWISQNTPYLNSFCMGFRLANIENYSVVFMGFLMRSSQIRNQIIMLGQGVIRVNLASSRLKTIMIPIPQLNEQQKIADCLFSIDELVTLQYQKVEALKIHKKGLMQGLFPSADEVSV